MTEQQYRVIKKVSQKTGVSEKKIYDILSSDVKTMIKTIGNFNINDESSYHVFILPNFGKFALNFRRAKKMYKNEN